MLICKAILGLLSNYLGIYVTSTNIWTLAVYSFPFVASSPDRDVPDSLYDALSASCKFVFLKARKFRNSFLWQSSKHSLQLCEMNPWELSLLWISFFFSLFSFLGGMLGLCLSVVLPVCPQNFLRCIIYLRPLSTEYGCLIGEDSLADFGSQKVQSG